MVESTRYVDVNIFVYWLGNHPVYFQAAQNWIKEIEGSHRGDYITSTLTLYETTVILCGLSGKNLKDKKFVSQIINAFTQLKKLRIEPLRVEDYQNAADMMNEFNLDYEDSLHLAVAMRTKVQEIISNDKDFDTVNIKRLI